MRHQVVPDVLIIDDERHVCEALQLMLELHNMTSMTAATPAEALELMRTRDFGVVIQDMNFSRELTKGDEGRILFRAIRKLDPELPVILLTGWTSLELAVALIKEGAADYLAKPWDNARLVSVVHQHLSRRRATLDARNTRTVLTEHPGFEETSHDLCGTIYRSPQMQEVVRLALRVSDADVPVLITGPNGTGKEKLAEIVQANSRRKRGPFCKVNVGAIPDELLESELFGTEAGAFTGANKGRAGWFETAHGGTLFLDEIGNLSFNGQRKLLRVLQTGEFSRLGSSSLRSTDVRIISATNITMQEEIRAGRFREDLYFRLNVIEIRIPALRERAEDVLPLAEHFLHQYGHSRPERPHFSAEALELLQTHTWPGNVRELHNRVQRAVLLSRSSVIGPEELDLATRQRADSALNRVLHIPRAESGAPAAAITAPRVAPMGGSLSAPSLESSRPIGGEKAEQGHHVRAGEGAAPADPDGDARVLIEQAIRDARGSISGAATRLGLSRQALYRRMERLGMFIEKKVRT